MIPQIKETIKKKIEWYSCCSLVINPLVALRVKILLF
jgi:hypothetical protein